jgi:hypothetical protein
MLSCIWITSNKLEKLLQLVGWFSWKSYVYVAFQLLQLRMLLLFLLLLLLLPFIFLTSLLPLLLTPWSRVLLEKLTVNFAASQEIPRIYETRKFLTVPKRARHLSLSWAFYGCVILPLETLPPGDPNGGIVYLRIVLSPEEASLHR